MRRANETDAKKLRTRMVAAFDLMYLDSTCKCTEGFDLDDDDVLVPVKACRTRLDHALRVARQAAAGFNPSGAERTHGGSIPNPVLAAVIAQAKKDGTWRSHMTEDWWYDQILSLVAVLNTAAGNLTILCLDLAKITATDPKDLGKNGQGSCPVCDTFCSGAVDDRLIAGLCDTDYRAWTRAGRPDRFRWVQERRGELAS